jgi:hypothetical protein
MTRLGPAVFVLCFVAGPPALAGQKVVIKGATPGDVVRAINNELAPQGFKLDDSSQTAARFSLDRGLVNQRTAQGVQGVPMVLELHLRFKPKSDGLEVSAYEELVAGQAVGVQSSTESRQAVRSQKEKEGMQTLLDFVKSDLEAKTKP